MSVTLLLDYSVGGSLCEFLCFYRFRLLFFVSLVVIFTFLVWVLFLVLGLSSHDLDVSMLGGIFHMSRIHSWMYRLWSYGRS